MRRATLLALLIILTGCATQHAATSCSGEVFAINPAVAR